MPSDCSGRAIPSRPWGRRWSNLIAPALFLLATIAGCGVPTTTFYPNALTDEQGNPILLEDVEEIVNDDELTESEKRDALRDLGIEDEKLIDALLE